jgi:hypothetical protein
LVFSSGEESRPNNIRFHFSFAAAICPEIQFQQPCHLAKRHSV